MWIGAIRLVVKTKDSLHAGTDSYVQVTILRDSTELCVLNLNYQGEDDLERGAIRNYDYCGLPRINDTTPELPPGIGQFPMPYPEYGLEFSNGLNGHIKLRLRIWGDDMWVKDKIDLCVRFIRQKADDTFGDSTYWVEDSNWTYKGSWTQDVHMSTDSNEGYTTLTLNLT